MGSWGRCQNNCSEGCFQPCAERSRLHVGAGRRGSDHFAWSWHRAAQQKRSPQMLFPRSRATRGRARSSPGADCWFSLTPQSLSLKDPQLFKPPGSRKSLCQLEPWPRPWIQFKASHTWGNSLCREEPRHVPTCQAAGETPVRQQPLERLSDAAWHPY